MNQCGGGATTKTTDKPTFSFKPYGVHLFKNHELWTKQSNKGRRTDDAEKTT